MSSKRGGPGRLDSLSSRLAALLTLAILPLGLIAVVQTYRVIGEASQRVDAALLGETLRATRPERGAIQSALGAAQALAAQMPELVTTTRTCREVLSDFVAQTDGIHFAGVIESSGMMTCASEGEPVDFSDSDTFADDMAEPRVIVRATPAGRVTERPAILVSAPIMEGGEMLGYVSLSVSHQALALGDLTNEQLTPIDILTFNAEGQLLTSSLGSADAATLLPRNRALAALGSARPAIFRDENATGQTAIYTITPLIEDTVFAMAVWPIELAPAAGGWLRWTIPTVVLPVMMWITSMGVAYFAVHRLVIRHIRRLRQRMRLFSRFRRVEEDPEDMGLPVELREVSETFVSMAHTIQRDEADLENSLHEKEVLLREVYHRVRNNLQLIASMNNMQMRATKSAETRLALHRLQDRIMALSTIHAALYQTPALAKIPADGLVVSLARQVAGKARSDTEIAVNAQTAQIRLYPDQAVPLSLLTVEAVTNAVKHLGRPAEGEAAFINIELGQHDGEVRLSIANSVGPESVGPEPPNGSGGLGMQLMNAFVVQLAGEIEIEETDRLYRLTVTFRPSDYGEEHTIV